MKPLKDLLASGIKSDQKIVLSEGNDPRVIEAAIAARKEGVARIVLLGNVAAITEQLANAGGGDLGGIEIHDPADTPLADEMAQKFYEIRKHKGVTLEGAREAILNPSVFAALLVKMDKADGTIGGAVTATAEIVRTAIQVIGPANDAKIVSSFFLMLFCKEYHEKKGAFVFSDAGLVIDPSAAEMAEIARASATSFSELTGDTPRVAMLSFSTRGSAKHDRVSKISEATAILREAAPDLLVDGELQFDAAFVPDIAKAKAPDSALGGNANVFVCPSLEAGNIGYKIAQRMGGAQAIGPILQGLAKPANDLSRGCSAEDILYMIAVTSAQCKSVTVN
jgi:phosphate acetyltransferase